jgi:hypothetical protein
MISCQLLGYNMTGIVVRIIIMSLSDIEWKNGRFQTNSFEFNFYNLFFSTDCDLIAKEIKPSCLSVGVHQANRINIFFEDELSLHKYNTYRPFMEYIQWEV